MKVSKQMQDIKYKKRNCNKRMYCCNNTEYKLKWIVCSYLHSILKQKTGLYTRQNMFVFFLYII